MSLSLRVLASLRRDFSWSSTRRLRGPLAAVGVALAGALLLPPPSRAALASVSVDITAFSPNADGIHDSVTIRWTTSDAPESLRAEVRRGGQGFGVPPLRAFAFGPQPAGSGQVTWDGRDTSGVIPPDGAYVVRVVELTASGIAYGEGVAAVLVDNTAPPVARFYDGLDGRDTTEAKIELGGYAPAADSVLVFLDGQPSFTLRIAASDSVFETSVTVAEGPHTFALESFDRAGNRAVLSPAISRAYRNTADISGLRAVPFEFSPDGDAVLDSGSVVFALDAPTSRLLVQVRAALPFLTGERFADTLSVVTLFDAPAAAGEHTFAWTGKDSADTDVPDGNWWYFAQAESADALGQPHPGRKTQALTAVDRSDPAIPFPNPAPPARTTRNTVVLRGTAVDADTVRVWRGATLVGRGSALPNWSVTVPLVLGTNVLTFDATERSGNHSARGSAVTIVYEEPLGLHAPEHFTANDVFDVNVSRTAHEVRIDLYELGGRRVRTLLLAQTGQSFEVPWDLRDEAGVTVGDGPYIARVTVSFDDGGTETKNGAVVVAK